MNSRILTILVAVLSIIGVFLFVRVSMTDTENVEAMSGAVSPLVTYSLVLFGLAVLAAIFASLMGVLKHPAALKKALLGLAVLAVVLVVAYAISPDNQVIDANGDIIAAAGGQVSKLTSTGIWVSTLLLIAGGAAFLVDLVKGLVK